RYTDFFFQAEDGIRDDLVTGVQTCALPICSIFSWFALAPARECELPHALSRRTRARGEARGSTLHDVAAPATAGSGGRASGNCAGAADAGRRASHRDLGVGHRSERAARSRLG